MLKRFYQDGELTTLTKAMLEAAAWISGVISAFVLFFMLPEKTQLWCLGILIIGLIFVLLTTCIKSDLDKKSRN